MAALVLRHDELTDKSIVSDVLIFIFFDIKRKTGGCGVNSAGYFAQSNYS